MSLTHSECLPEAKALVAVGNSDRHPTGWPVTLVILAIDRLANVT